MRSRRNKSVRGLVQPQAGALQPHQKRRRVVVMISPLSQRRHAAGAWRVGESSERKRGSHRQYTSEELVYWAEVIVGGRIKWPKLQRLYDTGIIRAS